MVGYGFVENHLYLPSFIDIFFALEFQDEDLLAYQWVCVVKSTSFLEQHVGRVLHRVLHHSYTKT